MTRKRKLFIFGGLAAATIVAAPLVVVACGSSSDDSSTAASSERAAFLAKYPNSLDGNSIAKLAFQFRTDLPADFALPSFVDTIGFSSFYNATLPSNFKVPAGVTTIETLAFGFARLPQGFTLPASVTLIDAVAFAGTAIPSGFAIPAGTKSLGLVPGVNGDEANNYYAPFGATFLPAGFTLPDTLEDVADTSFTTIVPPEVRLSVQERNYISILPVNATVPIGFTIPATTKVWTIIDLEWTTSADTALKVELPANAMWSDSRGAVAGSTVVAVAAQP